MELHYLMPSLIFKTLNRQAYYSALKALNGANSFFTLRITFTAWERAQRFKRQPFVNALTLQYSLKDVNFRKTALS